MDEEYVKKLVIARLKTIPPNVSFSIGSHGDFTREDIIRQVSKGTDVGREFIKSEMELLVQTPNLVGRLSRHD